LKKLQKSGKKNLSNFYEKTYDALVTVWNIGITADIGCISLADFSHVNNHPYVNKYSSTPIQLPQT
jgi:hypothetical protein